MKFLFNNNAKVELPNDTLYTPFSSFDNGVVIFFNVPDGEYERFVFDVKEKFPTVQVEGNKFTFKEDDLFVSNNLPVKENQHFRCFGIEGISTGFGIRDREGKFSVVSKTLDKIDISLNEVLLLDEENQCIYPLIECELINR